MNKKGDHGKCGSHGKHMWMMAACCGLPIVGFLAIGWLGINAPSLETLIAIICPVGMVIMMYMMRHDHQTTHVPTKKQIPRESTSSDPVVDHQSGEHLAESEANHKDILKA